MVDLYLSLWYRSTRSDSIGIAMHDVKRQFNSHRNSNDNKLQTTLSSNPFPSIGQTLPHYKTPPTHPPCNPTLLTQPEPTTRTSHGTRNTEHLTANKITNARVIPIRVEVCRESLGSLFSKGRVMGVGMRELGWWMGWDGGWEVRSEGGEGDWGIVVGGMGSGQMR